MSTIIKNIFRKDIKGQENVMRRQYPRHRERVSKERVWSTAIGEQERPISFGNMTIVDRNDFREVVMVKTILEWAKETVGDKDPDPVSLVQSFKNISCEGQERNMW